MNRLLLALEATLWLGWVRLTASRIDLQSIFAAPSPKEPSQTTVNVMPIANMVGWMAKVWGPLFRPNCLHKSVALWKMLRRRGVSAEINIGVMKDGPTLKAHAWVEHNGQVLNDTSAVKTRYAPFDFSQLNTSRHPLKFN